MADTAEKNIVQAAINHMKALPLPTGMTHAANVAFPGVKFTPQATTKFISFEIHFNRAIRTDLSQQIEPVRQGFIRGNVMWPLGWVQLDAFDAAGIICDHFKVGTKIYDEGRQVRFDDDPEVGPLVIGTTHFTVPVTAFWQSYPQVPA